MTLSTAADRLKVLDRIETWIEDERMSDGGGWAPCSREDLQELYDTIYEMMALKFEKDADGDLPVQVIVVNRITHQCMHWTPMPHMSRDPDEEELLAHFDIAFINFGMANNQLEQAWKMFYYIRNRKKEE